MTTKDVSDEKLPTLLRDGISEELFKLLWSKDELNYGPPLNIPDTIIYKFGQPVAWYFTSVSGRVKRKNKQNLISAKIEEVFNTHVLGYDVLAMFIAIPNDQDQMAEHTIEYLDRDALNSFLYNRKKDINGILQRFIEPKSTKNQIVRAIWSPKVCLLERAENIHHLHDHRYGLYERCVIYEGPEYYTTSAPLRGPVLSGQIQKLCESIVSHISEVTFGQKQVSRIVVNFKVDSRDKIWLLYSTSIRCIDMLEYTNAADSTVNLQRHLVNIDSVVSLSNTVHLNPTKRYDKILPKRRIRCLSCSKETLEDLRHPVSYKSIIKHYEHVMHLLTTTSDDNSTNTRTTSPNKSRGNSTKERMILWPPDAELLEAAGGVGFGSLYITDVGEVLSATQIAHNTKLCPLRELQIPPILQNIHYKLSNKSYYRCKNDPLFLFKTVHVCEPCYLVYAEFTTMLLRMGQDLTKLLTPDPIALEHLYDNQQRFHPHNTATGSSSSSKLHSRQPTSNVYNGNNAGSGGNGNSYRPSSADWRAISTANNNNNNGYRGGSPLRSTAYNDSNNNAMNRSMSYTAGGSSSGDGSNNNGSSAVDFHRSANHRHARESAIGLRTDDARMQPDLPQVICNSNSSSSHNLSAAGSYVLNSVLQNNYTGNGSSSSHPLQQGNNSKVSSSSSYFPVRGGAALEFGSTSLHSLPATALTAGYVGGSTTSSTAPGGEFDKGYNADEVRNAIADRERHFFKEISLNPNLKDQHPLMHLISTQQQLKLVDQQSGVLASKTANKSESIFGTRYGKQAGDVYQKLGAYAVPVPYVINGEVILPAQLKQRQQKERQLKKSRSLRALLNPDDYGGENNTEMQLSATSGGSNNSSPNRTNLPSQSSNAVSRGGNSNGSQAASRSNTSSQASTDQRSLKSSLMHRDFLAESLKRIEGDMEASAAYVGQQHQFTTDSTVTDSKTNPSTVVGTDNEITATASSGSSTKIKNSNKLQQNKISAKLQQSPAKNSKVKDSNTPSNTKNKSAMNSKSSSKNDLNQDISSLELPVQQELATD